jgi:hypothetical protein
MKRLTLLKNKAKNREMLHRLGIASSLSTLYEFMRKSPLKNRAGLLDTYVKAKTTKFFGLATEITKIFEFLLKLPIQIIASSLLCVNIFGR